MIGDIWLANHSVTRWHVNPHLCRIGQTVADHTAGMLGLCLTLWPNASTMLLRAIVVHDAPEYRTGDVPWHAKQAWPDLDYSLEGAETDVRYDEGWQCFGTTEDDDTKLKFLDRLEAYRFAKLHAPQIMDQPDWVECKAWLAGQAIALKVTVEQWL